MTVLAFVLSKKWIIFKDKFLITQKTSLKDISALTSKDVVETIEKGQIKKR